MWPRVWRCVKRLAVVGIDSAVAGVFVAVRFLSYGVVLLCCRVLSLSSEILGQVYSTLGVDIGWQQI